MATKELLHIAKFYNLLDGGVYTATQTSAALDTLNTEAAAILVIVGAAAVTGTFTPSLTECNTLAGTYTAVDTTINVEWFINGISQLQLAGWNQANQIVPVISTAVNVSTVIGVSYLGGMQRFLKLVMTGATTPSANFAIVGAVGTLREVGPKAFTNWPVGSATLP